MLSTASMHQYSPAFAPLPSSNMGGPSPTMEHTLNLKTSKSRHHPYDAQRNSMNINAASGAGQVSSSPSQSGTPGPIRRRISRACDQCNQLRTKCDGKLPCQHCIGIFELDHKLVFFLIKKLLIIPRLHIEM